MRYLHLRTKGLSAARNAALREAAGEIVAFMDDDCEAEVDWLAQLDRCFEDDVDLVSGAVLAPARERRRFAVCPSVVPGEVTFVLRPGDAALPTEFDALGANLAVRRRTAVRVGGFDEHLGAGARFPGGEEHDLVHRLAMAGATLRSTPGAVVRHTYGVRSGMRAVYRHRRQRLRGDGAGGEAAMLAVPEGGLPVGRTVRRAAGEQLETVRLGRLPFAVLRLFDYLTSYRECLRHFALSEAALHDPALAVLMPRRDEGRRRVTAPPALPPRQ